MSQSSFLEDAASWSADECQNKLHLALPKLTTYYDKSGTNTDVLRLICDRFLPVCSTQEMEELIFSKICTRVVDSYLQIFDDITRSCGQENSFDLVQEEVLVLIETCMQIVDCSEKCVTHALELMNAENNFDISNIHSLPKIVLPLIQSSYNHCKNSNDIYKELFGVVSTLLSTFFKRVHSLQMAFVTLVDKLNFLEPTDSDVKDMCYIISTFCEIGYIAGRMEVKIMLTMWKSVQRLASQYKTHLWDQLDMDPIIECICDDITASFSSLMEEGPHSSQGDDKSFIKNIKVVGFRIKVLCALIKEYESCLGTSVRCVYRVLLLIQRWLPPSLHQGCVSGILLEEVQKQVGMATEPLITHLLSNPVFIQTATAQDQKISEELYLPWLLTLTKICDLQTTLSDDVEERWTRPTLYREDTPTLPLIKSIFSALQSCYIELNVNIKVPGVMCKGKPMREVSLYEHVVTRICALVASCSSKHFSLMEECLLENVLSPNHLSACAAIDVWSFTARYGTAELCRDQCLFLSRLLTAHAFSPTPQCCHLVVLIRRLVKFLAPQHQEELLVNFPVAANMELWGYINIEFFPEQKQSEILSSMTAAAMATINSWTDLNGKTRADLINLCSTVYGIHGVYAAAARGGTCLPPGTDPLRAASTSLLLSLTPRDVASLPGLRVLAAGLINLLSLLTAGLDTQHILTVISYISDVLESCDEVKLAALSYISSLGRKVFPESFEQTQLLQLLPVMFRILLSDSNPAIHQVALDVFSVFAEETQHSCVVPDSLEGGDNVRDAVVTYLNQLANPQPLTGGDIERTRKQWPDVQQYHQQGPCVHEPELVEHQDACAREPEPAVPDITKDHRTRKSDIAFQSEGCPAAKRPCVSPGIGEAQDTPTSLNQSTSEPQIRKEIAKINQSLDTLVHLNNHTDLPHWFKEEMNKLAVKIKQFS